MFGVFDNASRGPMGAAQLLLLRYRHVVSIGCVVTLMALVSNAFIQQAVSYPTRAAVSSQLATIPYAQVYDINANNYSGSPILWPGMMAAIYDGALMSNLSQTSSSITPQCSTGNCSFPEFASLAICSRCADASHLLSETSETSGTFRSLPNGLTIGDAGGINGSGTIASLNLLPKSSSIFVDVSLIYSNFSSDGVIRYEG
jgi:hypothetical protein